MDVQCKKDSDVLLTYDITYIAGYECTSVGLYVIILFVACVIQVIRNFLWTKSAQASREALHQQRGSRGRSISILLTYTFFNMILYIMNVLLILGSNLGILASILVGNMIGTYLSMSWQKADKTRLGTQLITMVHEYKDLLSRRGILSPPERLHLKRLETSRELLSEFVSPKIIRSKLIY